MITYIGIDPGVSGAYAVLKCKGTEIREVSVHKWEDLQSIAHHLHTLKAEPFSVDTFAALERVHASPQMGRSSIFTFGCNAGMWEGMLAGAEIPYEKVSPQTWQKTVYNTKATRLGKEYGLNFVSLHPAFVGRVSVGKNHNYADALCLALYAKGFYEQLS